VENEVLALGKLEAVISSAEFEQALKICFETTGAVVVVGMGKSGLVAQKIAATLTSTGTNSRFLHAGDAMHGDLGAIGKDDCVIIISKSGETKEALLILPFLKEQKNKIIAITNEPASTLAKEVDVVLLMGVNTEACPLNLAPMTSTTVTMALGDALAAALVVAKDFKQDMFAKFHPGGKLGWLLTSKVSDMLDSKVNPVLGHDANLKDAVVSLVETRLGGVSIVDEKGKLAGLITDGDLKRVMLAESAGWQNKKVADIMRKEPITVNPETSGAEALKLMEQRESQISVLPVIDDNGAPVGILRLHDVIRTYL
jgi:arabinose-5-phosphate isomerase